MTEEISKAAGILFITPDKQALLLKRGPGGDHPLEWCFPGGTTEGDETPEETAKRETIEEIGFLPEGERRVLTRQIAEGVDYTTFLQQVPEIFMPKVNGEHVGFMWVDIKSLTEPIAPAAVPAADAEFEESEHPREKGGQFKDKGSTEEKSGGRAAELKPAKTGEGGKRTTASGEPLPEHIAKLKLPPAWTDVHYSDNPKADLLAVGKDAKGRVQSVYSEAFTKTQAAAKFARIDELRHKFTKILAQNAEAQSSEIPKIKDSADCLDLIIKMGIRPGSEADTGAAVKAYGATTLEGRHVVVEGKHVSLRFVGKKGVALDLPVHDETLAAQLRARAKAAGKDGKLFPYTSDKALLEHVHSMDGGGFKTKDFRTHLGTSTAYKLVKETPAPKSEKEYKKAVMAIAKEVAATLGNTPTIALQSYISPTVFSEWRAKL